MTDLNEYWNALRKSYGLYGAEKYRELIDFIKEEIDKYPGFRSGLYYPQMCAAVKLENHDLSLELFKEVIDEGGWYSEMILQQTPEFQPLQGMPEFKRLSRISVERFKEESMKNHDLTVFPDKSSGPFPLMLALHADGGLMKEEYAVWKGIVDHGYVLGMPRSTYVHWSRDGANWSGHQSAVDQVKAYVDKLLVDGSIDPKKTVLGGLSSGGGLAVKLSLTGAVPARGFVVVAPGGPETREPEKWLPLIDQAKNRDLQGIIIRGGKDTAIPRENIQQLVEMLNDGGISCIFREYPEIGHWYPSDFMDVVTSFTNELDNG
ncbi:MAG: hypothetical protein ACFFD4_04860 [Candidatus Odinarchaeota archaeon]